MFDRRPWLAGLPGSLVLALVLGGPESVEAAGTATGDVSFGGCADLCVGDSGVGSYELDGAACDETYASTIVGSLPTGVGDLTVKNGARLTSPLTIGRRGIGSALFESGAQMRPS